MIINETTKTRHNRAINQRAFGRDREMNKIAVFIMGLNTNLILVLILFVLLIFSMASGISFILIDKKLSKLIK